MLPFGFIIYKRIEKLILLSQKNSTLAWNRRFTETEDSGSSCRYSWISKISKFCLFVVLKEKFERFAWNEVNISNFCSKLSFEICWRCWTTGIDWLQSTTCKWYKKYYKPSQKKELYYYELVMQQDVQATHYVSRCHMLNTV